MFDLIVRFCLDKPHTNLPFMFYQVPCQKGKIVQAFGDSIIGTFYCMINLPLLKKITEHFQNTY
jgi:hypothetical protein